MRLHRIDDVLQRFENGWEESIACMLAMEKSFFAFFEALADSAGDIRAVSQKNAFLLLAHFADRRYVPDDSMRVKQCLRRDWEKHEIRRPPVI